MKFVNLTPHDVTVLNQKNSSVVFSRSGLVARVKEIDIYKKYIDDFTFSKKMDGEIINLPEPETDTFYIVSAQVASKVKRADVISPGDLIRDVEGVVVGCEGFRFWD